MSSAREEEESAHAAYEQTLFEMKQETLETLNEEEAIDALAAFRERLLSKAKAALRERVAAVSVLTVSPANPVSLSTALVESHQSLSLLSRVHRHRQREFRAKRPRKRPW